MKVPLTIRDHFERGTLVYPDRVAMVDEPDQPATSLGTITFGRLGELARAQAAALDERGIGVGERVAVVSHNAARLFTSFFGVSGFGRVLVPINFRLTADEVAYIVEHSGASMLMVDPELDDALSGIDCKHRVVLGAEDSEIYKEGTEPVDWAADEDATGTINYTSGTTARPKGVQLTHRSLWVNSTVFGWQAGVSDRDRYLHTLPMFHCNGWGMPYALTAMGAEQVVLRKVDGPEILRRVDAHGITLMCGGPRGGRRHPRRGWRMGWTDPRCRSHPHRGGRRAAADAHHRAGRDRAGLGVHPDLRAHRDRAAPDHEPASRGVGRPRAR
jgi:acyl-CoA synthetase (AMP-forming)/AMP-acid ligase II